MGRWVGIGRGVGAGWSAARGMLREFCYGTKLMELIDMIAGSLKTVKESLDLDPKHDFSLAAQVVELRARIADLQHLLDEAERELKERDELIAQLRAAIPSTDEMLVEGAAWFLQRSGEIVDGPFCTGCFTRHQQTVRLLDVSESDDGPGQGSGWVQCPTCAVPVRSRLVAEQSQNHGANWGMKRGETRVEETAVALSRSAR